MIAASLGGYAFSAASAAFGAVVLPLVSGVSRADAAVAMGMLAFLIYLSAAIWAFAQRGLLHLYQVLFGGAVLLFLAAHGLMCLAGAP